MEIVDAQNFLQQNHRACIAVRQKDGWPQMTFVSPGIDPQGPEIIEQPAAMDMLIYWYKQVRGEHKNWEEYKKRMADEKRVIIRVNIEKVGPQTVNRI